MTLNEMITSLQNLQAQGHGDKLVYSHSASGDCGELGYPSVTARVEGDGPFDFEVGEEYIGVYAGN